MGKNMARVTSPTTPTEEIEVTKMAILGAQAEQKKCDKVVTDGGSTVQKSGYDRAFL
jgi:hypothetical protein